MFLLILGYTDFLGKVWYDTRAMINMGLGALEDFFLLIAGEWHESFNSGDCIIMSEILHITNETL